MNPMKSTIDLYIFLQKDDIQQTFYHYVSKICSFISYRNSKTDGSTDDSPTRKRKQKNIWRQHDTYEREGGGVAVVTYLNPEGQPIPRDDCDDDDNNNDDDSEDGMEMRMWMSMPFTLRTVSAMTELSAKASMTGEADTFIPNAAPIANISPVPTARSNVMSLLSTSANGANKQPTTSGLDALRNLDYFNVNTQTV